MIHSPTDKASFRIWEKGFDLMTFLVAEAAPELSDAYRAACSGALELTVNEGDALGDLRQVLGKASSYGSNDIAYLEYQRHLVFGNPDGHWPSHRNLFKLLCHGVLIGFGFISPRRPEDAPKPNPTDIWNSHVDWEQSEVSGNGVSYAGVRIVSSRLVDSVIGGYKSESTAKPVGRPSVKARVFEAFSALSRAGAIDFAQPMNRAYEPIRQWLGDNYSENRGLFGNLSDETIRREITNEFKSRREAQKQ